MSGVEHGPRCGPLTVFSRVAPRVVAPVRSPRRAVDRDGYSMVASAQQCAASSRATATTTIERGLPRLSSACQRPCSRRPLRSAWACTTCGLPSRLRSSVTLLRGGRRWCQAASISSRRTWLLPALVIAPWRRRSPLECSLGVRPRNGPSACGRKRVQSPSSTVRPSAVRVEKPRRQQSRPTVSANGGSAASSAIAWRARPRAPARDHAPPPRAAPATRTATSAPSRSSRASRSASRRFP